jgi:hypothetical protein
MREEINLQNNCKVRSFLNCMLTEQAGAEVTL